MIGRPELEASHHLSDQVYPRASPPMVKFGTTCMSFALWFREAVALRGEMQKAQRWYSMTIAMDSLTIRLTCLAAP
jgi:hypothetical protein